MEKIYLLCINMKNPQRRCCLAALLLLPFAGAGVRVVTSNILPIDERGPRDAASRRGYISDHCPVWAELEWQEP